MKILILGAGKMGRFFCDVLSFDHRVGIYDFSPERLRFVYNAERFKTLDEVDDFDPDLVINAATVKYTLQAFESVLPHIQPDAVLSDIASVKTGLPGFYAGCGHPFVSTHPMFGPTFASLSNLSRENAIIIKEGDEAGREFFRNLYHKLHLNIVDYTFEEHDLTIAYSLSIPFAATLAFASVMKHQDAPGTTFKRHMEIARGLMNEDDFLVSEILFNPNTPGQLDNILSRLTELRDIVGRRDSAAMKQFLASARANLD